MACERNIDCFFAHHSNRVWRSNCRPRCDRENGIFSFQPKEKKKKDSSYLTLSKFSFVSNAGRVLRSEIKRLPPEFSLYQPSASWHGKIWPASKSEYYVSGQFSSPASKPQQARFHECGLWKKALSTFNRTASFFLAVGSLDPKEGGENFVHFHCNGKIGLSVSLFRNTFWQLIDATAR